MDDLRKKYLELLELNEDCTETEINKKYDNLSLRAKTDKSIDIDEVIKAYDYLMNRNLEEPEPVKPIVKKFRKAWFKYIGLAAILLIILGTVLSIVIPYITNKDPDLYI